MRYGIFADVHANLEALEAVLRAYQHERVDEYLCVGDIIGYAANPKECIEKVKSIAKVSVAGNHDWAGAGLFSVDYFNPFAKEAISWTKNNLDSEARDFLGSLSLEYKNEYLTLVHGTLDNPREFNYMRGDYQVEETFRLLETRLCFVGHSHVAGIVGKDQDGRTFYHDNFDSGRPLPRTDNSGVHIEIRKNVKYIINVGSVGQPRDSNPAAAYCIFDTEKMSVDIKRVIYDAPLAREKIISAGLPRFLGDRLLTGR
ncbi:MAG: metallophosphoesterase family protein [Candidatus Omnitrophica bacterium]|nr:metallophosphoesterase family protein [Candidatus Omnitrophota bacterium]